MMIVGQMLMFIVVTVTLICLTLPCRHNVTRLVRRVVPIDAKSNYVHIISTVVLVACTFLMTVYVP